MPAVTRVGDANTGHDACPPATLASGSPNVTVNGKAVGRVGDPYVAHGCKDHSSHVGTIATGAPCVFVNGKAVGRIGDAVSCGGTVAAGASDVIVGNSGGNRSEFKTTLLKSIVEEYSSKAPEDEIILSMPEIAKNIATKQADSNDQQGWKYLSKFFSNWLYNGSSPYVVSNMWQWALNYSRFYVAYHKLIDETMFSLAGQKVLVERLKKDEVWEQGGSFNFSQKVPSEWDDYYFNYVTVREGFPVDGLMAALGSHTIRVLADGEVKVDASTNCRIVTVNKVVTYIRDTFNFASNDDYHYWSKIEKDYSPLPPIDNPQNYERLTDAKFRRFREKYNTGKDFIVLSNGNEVGSFHGFSFSTR